MTTPGFDAHPDLELQDLLDGRCDPSVRTRVERHLRSCVDCQRRFAALELARAAVRGVAEPATLTPDLSARLSAALDQVDDDPAERPWRTWRWVAAAALVVAVLATILLRGSEPDVVALVISDYRTLAGSLPAGALRTSDAAELERFLGATPLAFPVRVLDLGMMGWELAGGGVEIVAGQSSVVLVYRRDGRTVICRMYLGSTTNLPDGGRVEDHRGFRFHTYERDGVTAVFWQEGPTVCVLVGDGPSRAVLELAFEKAMAPA